MSTNLPIAESEHRDLEAPRLPSAADFDFLDRLDEAGLAALRRVYDAREPYCDCCGEAVDDEGRSEDEIAAEVFVLMATGRRRALSDAEQARVHRLHVLAHARAGWEDGDVRPEVKARLDRGADESSRWLKQRIDTHRGAGKMSAQARQQRPRHQIAAPGGRSRERRLAATRRGPPKKGSDDDDPSPESDLDHAWLEAVELDDRRDERWRNATVPFALLRWLLPWDVDPWESFGRLPADRQAKAWAHLRAEVERERP